MKKSGRLQQRILTTGDIAEAVAVNRSVVSDWLARGIITAPQAPGRGHSRRFSLWNVVQAWIARDLNRMGIRAGAIKTIFAVADVEFFQLNTALLGNGGQDSGQDDCVLLIGFGSDGDVGWVRRESTALWTPAPADLDDAVVVLRIDVNAAMRHVAAALHQRLLQVQR